MSYFEDQEDAWFANDCKGLPDQYDPHTPDSWPKRHTATGSSSPAPMRTKSQKRNAQRKAAKLRAKSEVKS